MLNVVYSPWHARVVEAATAMAKPGCQQLCGDTVIPYPFGIGNSSCFYDEWFEMECADDSRNPNTKPFLKKPKLEVTEIHFPTIDEEAGLIVFNNPIIASSPNCTSGDSKVTTASPLDLTGSTFYFSSDYNNFAGSGCSNQVSLIDSKGKQVPDIKCISTCPQDATIGTCCKIDVPDHIQLVNVSFSGTTDGDGGCRYAMIASIEEWLDLNPGTACSSAMTDTDSVPAWLEWGLKASSPETIVQEKQSTAHNAAIGIFSYTYGDGNINQFAFYNKGFEGNAYLPDGCQDVNECNLGSSCTRGTCENTVGGYECHSSETPKTKSTKIGIIVACPIVGVLVIILAVWVGFNLRKIWQENKLFIKNGGLLLQREGKNTKIFKVRQLETATNNFSKKNRLGEGGQGTVYKGTLTLPGGTTVVAIKECKKIKPRTKSNSSTAVRDAGDEMGAFITEVVLLSETIHKNIVRLLGCCLNTETPLLVYEYLVNGDLSHHLHNDKNNNADFTLSWEVRLEREGRNRPTMKDVSMELENIRAQHANIYAKEIDEHDYDRSIGGPPASPFRRQELQEINIE